MVQRVPKINRRHTHGLEAPQKVLTVAFAVRRTWKPDDPAQTPSPVATNLNADRCYKGMAHV